MRVDEHEDKLENYKLERVIGRGGSSRVYVASCLQGHLKGRLVAVKAIPCTSLPTPNHLAHHLDSTSLHLKLKHPSIVSLLSSFSTHAEYYQILELCPGGTLSSLLQRRPSRTLTEAETRSVSKDIVDAMMYLADQGIIHRDIKADNVLLTEEGRVRLADFGLAKKVEPPRFEAKTFCGTPNYLSPEIITRHPYGAASDVWAFGCLMITLLSGKPPFQGETVNATLERAALAQYTLPKALSSEAVDLISKLLRINPRQRISIYGVLSQPFFDAKWPVVPLSYHNDTTSTRSSSSPTTRPLRRVVTQSFPRPVSNKENAPPQPNRLSRIRTSSLGALAHIQGHTRNASDEVVFDISAVTAHSNRHHMPLSDQSALGVHNRDDPALVVRSVGRAKSNVAKSRTRLKSIGLSSDRLTSPEPMSTKEKDRRKTPIIKERIPSGEPELSEVGPPEPQTRAKLQVQHNISTSDPASPLLRLTRSRRPSSRISTHTSSDMAQSAIPAAHISRPSGKTSLQLHRSNPPFVKRTSHDAASLSATPLHYESPSSSHGLTRSSTSRPMLSNTHTSHALPPHDSHNIATQNSHRHSTSNTNQTAFYDLVQFETSPLTPQAHTTPYGHLSILKDTGDLLMDLRESERNAVGTGNEVIKISGTGDFIEIFQTPSSSAPVLLNSPVKAYHLEVLPREYWKRYRYGARFIELLKSRTPKFILYTPVAKCTLMSNTPTPDIELLFRSSHKTPQSRFTPDRKSSATTSEPTMRIRLSRVNHTIEVYRFTPSLNTDSGTSDTRLPNSTEVRRGEWMKKVLSVPEAGTGAFLREDALDLQSLSPVEKEGLAHLDECRRVCEVLEFVESEPSVRLAGSSGDSPPVREIWRSFVDGSVEDNPITIKDGAALESGVRTLRESAWLEIQERQHTQRLRSQSTLAVPRSATPGTSASSGVTVKSLSLLPAQSSDSIPSSALTESAARPDLALQNLQRLVRSVIPQYDPVAATSRSKPDRHDSKHTKLHVSIPSSDLFDRVETRVLDTRFLDCVGWCVKYASGEGSVSAKDEASRFRVMFLDGASLEVEVAEHLITFTDRRQNVIIHQTPISKDLPRKVKERLAVFEEFLTLFTTRGTAVQ